MHCEPKCAEEQKCPVPCACPKTAALTVLGWLGCQILWEAKGFRIRSCAPHQLVLSVAPSTPPVGAPAQGCNAESMIKDYFHFPSNVSVSTSFPLRT